MYITHVYLFSTLISLQGFHQLGLPVFQIVHPCHSSCLKAKSYVEKNQWPQEFGQSEDSELNHVLMIFGGDFHDFSLYQLDPFSFF